MSSLVTKQHSFLVNVAHLIEEATRQGFEVTGGELFRTAEQQAIHKAAGRSSVDVSQHQKRLAIDLNFFKNGQWVQEYLTLRPLGEYWKSLNPHNRWGGDWKHPFDPYHFERASE